MVPPDIDLDSLIDRWLDDKYCSARRDLAPIWCLTSPAPGAGAVESTESRVGQGDDLATARGGAIGKSCAVCSFVLVKNPPTDQISRIPAAQVPVSKW